MNKSLYILDGHAQIYRAYYAPFGELTSPSGEPTRATHVFCNMLLKLLRERRPDFLAMTMDVSDGSVFRCEIDPSYKANREPPPDDFGIQADRIVSIISSMNIPLHRMIGFEADDLMATIVEQLRDEPIDVYLVSKDKDLEQLLSPQTHLYDPGKDVVTDAASLLENKGYRPDQSIDIQTLTGDATDNIPGVHGVGVKTAAKLIAKYGSARAVLEHANELTPKAAERMKAFADQMEITRKLVTLRRDVPLDFKLDDCRVDTIDLLAAAPTFTELGFNRLTDQLDKVATIISTGLPHTINPDNETSDRSQLGTYTLVNTVDALIALSKALAKQPSFAFDTETTGLNPVANALVGISISFVEGSAYYLPVMGANADILSVDVVVEHLKGVFENPAIQKIGQNLKYDCVVLRQIGIEVAGLAFDTMIASSLLDPMSPSHGLDYLVGHLLQHDMIPIKDLIGKGKNQITMAEVDVATCTEYASEDADFTWRLGQLLAPQMAESNVATLFHETEMPLVNVLAEMEHHGISLDVKLLASLSESMGTTLISLTKKIFELVGHEFNVDSPKQLGVVMFDELGLRVVKKTRTGRSTDADTLQTLASETDNPLPKLILEYRELAKLKNTYVDALPKMVCQRTQRVHASFNQTGAITGRLSSSDPNLQNIPIRTETGRQIRYAFIACDADHVLLAADYSQVELRLLAHFCQDQALVKAFGEGQDIHRAVAAQVNGVALEDVTSEQRSAAKAVNFGIIYGQSAFGLAKSLGIPKGEAKAFIDMYFMRYPGIRMFIDDCIARTKKTGYAETILGRRRPIPELQSRNKNQHAFGERIAVNTVVQGSAADVMKRAMINIHHDIKAGQLDAKMLIQVHDELVFEIPKVSVDSAATLIRERLENALPLTVPLVVDIAWGNNWAEGK